MNDFRKKYNSFIDLQSISQSFIAYLATDNFDKTADVNFVATSNATSDISGGVTPSKAEYMPMKGSFPEVMNCDIAGGVDRMLASQPPMNEAVLRWSNRLEVTVPEDELV